jgi:hypothetical protein
MARERYLGCCAESCGRCTLCVFAAKNRPPSVREAFLSHTIYAPSSKPTRFENIFSIGPSVKYRRENNLEEPCEVEKPLGMYRQRRAQEVFDLDVGGVYRSRDIFSPASPLASLPYEKGSTSTWKSITAKNVYRFSPTQKSMTRGASKGPEEGRARERMGMQQVCAARGGEPYNPLASQAYDTSFFPRIKALVVSGSPLLKVFHGMQPDLGALIRVNEIYGLPRISQSNLSLTEDLLRIVISHGGLQAVDEGGLWKVVVSELHHHAEGVGRLRVYYMMACYFYEQVIAHVPQETVRNEHTCGRFVVVYGGCNQEEGMGLLLGTLLSAKKRTRGEPMLLALPKESSGLMEIVCFVNHIYRSEVRLNYVDTLLIVLPKIRSLRCSAELVRSILTCRELDALKSETHAVVMRYLKLLLSAIEENPESRISVYSAKEMIARYEEYLEEEIVSFARGEYTETVKMSPRSSSPRVVGRTCIICGTKMISELPQLVCRVLEFISRASVFCSTHTSLSIIRLIFSEKIQAECTSFDEIAFGKVLFFYWNVLKSSSPSRGTGIFYEAVGSDELRMFAAKVSSMIMAAVNSRDRELISKRVGSGEFELAIKLLTCDAAVFRIFVDAGFCRKRLMSTWRFLIALYSDEDFSLKPLFASSIFGALEALSAFLLGFPEELQTSRGLFGTEWLSEMLAHANLPHSVFRVCDMIFK